MQDARHIDDVTTESCLKSNKKPLCDTSTHNNLFLLNIQHRRSGIGRCFDKGEFSSEGSQLSDQCSTDLLGLARSNLSIYHLYNDFDD